MGATHTWNGVNYADAFNTAMTVSGAACLAIGMGMLAKPRQWALAARTRLQKHAS